MKIREHDTWAHRLWQYDRGRTPRAVLCGGGVREVFGGKIPAWPVHGIDYETAKSIRTRRCRTESRRGYLTIDLEIILANPPPLWYNKNNHFSADGFGRDCVRQRRRGRNSQAKGTGSGRTPGKVLSHHQRGSFSAWRRNLSGKKTGHIAYLLCALFCFIGKCVL